MAKKELTPKQQAFIAEYLTDFNASAAAVRAGYCPKTAPEIGYENLRKPHIIKKIVARRDELAREARADQERVLAAECCIAFSDIRKLFNGEAPIPLEDLPEEVARAIASFEVKERALYNDGERVETITTYKYKFRDKGRSLERLGCWLGM
jgi:phage terminase small subunit